MDNNTDILSRLLADPSMPVPLDWLKAVREEHPTFVLPVALLLSRNAGDVDPDTLKQLQAAATLGCADPTAMADLCDMGGQGWATIYPPAEPPKQKSTDDTIDAFLRSYGRITPQEEAVLERQIFNPVPPDYILAGDELAQEEPQPEPAAKPQPVAKEEPAPAAEVAEQPQEPAAHPARKAPTHPAPAAENAEPDTLLMESLAKIFIKQRRFERAFEIITNLSLKYPEKSVYFADQLRFLQKLIINSKYSKKQ